MTIGLPWISSNLLKEDGSSYFEITFDVDNCHKKIFFRTSNESVLETGGSIWHASYRMINYLLDNPDFVKGKRVLEIGL